MAWKLKKLPLVRVIRLTLDREAMLGLESLTSWCSDSEIQVELLLFWLGRWRWNYHWTPYLRCVLCADPLRGGHGVTAPGLCRESICQLACSSFISLWPVQLSAIYSEHGITSNTKKFTLCYGHAVGCCSFMVVRRTSNVTKKKRVLLHHCVAGCENTA